MVSAQNIYSAYKGRSSSDSLASLCMRSISSGVPAAVHTPTLASPPTGDSSPFPCQHDAAHPQVRPLGLTGFPGNVIVLVRSDTAASTSSHVRHAAEKARSPAPVEDPQPQRGEHGGDQPEPHHDRGLRPARELE